MTSAQWATDNDLFMLLAITPSLVALGSALREGNVNNLSVKRIKRKDRKKKEKFKMIELLSECVSYPWIPEAAGVCHLTGFMRETNKQKAGQQ